MAHTYETPTIKAGASRDILGGSSREYLSLAAQSTQFKILARPHTGWKLVLALLIFGEAA